MAGNLNKHNITHTGEKAYSCSQCNKSLNQASNFKTHMRIHIGENSYSRSQCDKRFTAVSTLNMYVEGVHML